ncbi:hypothetical protein [uncultured Kocuria sp.]|uniref:hypothetical protein n=1 Tax=uncultured Kocuria sp. TaxID=259305 RepID=UPI002622A512|nr:hypothetical protein [uncultured Kocuria sp.]
MAPTLYEWMTPQQADEALGRFVAERAPALQRLRALLLLDQDRAPDTLLDGTLDSVAPVWEWITGRCAELGVARETLEDDPTRDSWPSWARHGKLVDPHPPARTLALLDGFVSYLAEVIVAAVPGARWRIGEHRISDHPLLNYPVLATEHHQLFLPALPLYSAYQSAHGRDPMDGAEMLAHTRRTIAALSSAGPGAAEEPPVSVVAEVDCFDVGLRADIVAQHPALVERLVAELVDRDGVQSVHRYGATALVVDVPDWDELRLKLWLTLWLQRHLP